jgi:thiol-disulfide isomerase/thioredoxin
MNYFFGLFRTFFLVLFFLFRGGIVFAKQPNNDISLAKQIFAKAKAYHKRDLIEMQWEYRIVSTLSADTGFVSYTWTKDETKNIFRFTKLDYNPIKDSSIGYFIGDFKDTLYRLILPDFESKKGNCKVLRRVVDLQNSFYPHTPPFLNFINPEFEFLNDSSIVNVFSNKKSDSIIIQNIKSNSQYVFVFNKLGQYLYFEENLKGELLDMEVVQKRYFRGFSYKKGKERYNTSLEKYNWCDSLPSNKSDSQFFKDKGFVTRDSLYTIFENKKFDFSVFDKISDFQQYRDSNKSILMFYTFVGCGPCMIVKNIMDKVLDSLGDKVSIVMIDPISDPIKQKKSAINALKKNKLDGRVLYLMVKENKKEVTFNNMIDTYPFMFFIDKNGTVRSIKIGLSPNEDIYTTISELIIKTLN